MYTLANEDVLLYDIRINGYELFTKEHIEKINKLNIVDFKLTWDSFRRLVYRLISNPSNELQEAILHQQQIMEPTNEVIGVHLRCGGQLADYKETPYWISPRELTEIPGIINAFYYKHHLHRKPSIYLSTDSSKAESYLRKIMTNFTIYTLNHTVFERGHTCGKSKSIFVRSSLVDMYTVAETGYHIISYGSGFSAAVDRISKIRPSFILPFHKRQNYICLLNKQNQASFRTKWTSCGMGQLWFLQLRRCVVSRYSVKQQVRHPNESTEKPSTFFTT